MKNFIALLVLVALAEIGYSQTRKIELFELVKEMTPTAPGKPTVFSTPADPVWTRDGSAQILIDGKNLTCKDDIGGKSHPCRWNVNTLAKKAQYPSFGIGTTDFPARDASDALKILFGKNASNFKLIKNCMEGASYWASAYEVRISGKVTVYMVLAWESMAATASQYESSGVSNTFSIQFYTQKNDMMRDYCN